jgi:bacillithiol biosynthesis cysteine-adding enzyme BshC
MPGGQGMTYYCTRNQRDLAFAPRQQWFCFQTTVHHTSFPFSSVPGFSNLLKAYAAEDPRLLPFCAGFPDVKSFQNQARMREANFSEEDRKILTEVLVSQMANAATEAQKKNLALLSGNHTLTVSCGHQLVLGGGPVYMAYKIASTIKLAERAEAVLGQPVVPVFWLASEDHDAEEISSFSFLGTSQKFSFAQSGAVGRFSTEGLWEAIQKTPAMPPEMAGAYQKPNLSEATRSWLNAYFGQYGLLILDADTPILKKRFWPWFQKELESNASEKHIQATEKELEILGFKSQIFARNLNLFRLTDGGRVRLERSENGIETVDKTHNWNLEEALSHFAANPETLSPNVCLRPLYSQVLLPDIAFVGGPAEIAYWMQLKSLFSAWDVHFPLLIPRFSALYLNPQMASLRIKLGLELAELIKEDGEIRKKLSGFSAPAPLPDLKKAFAQQIEEASRIDITLVPALKAEIHRMEASGLHFQNRLRKAAERRASEKIGQWAKLRNYSFPEGSLQERKEGWLSFVVENPAWLDQLMKIVDPLDFQFCIWEESPAP